MVHDFQKKAVANLFAQFNPVPPEPEPRVSLRESEYFEGISLAVLTEAITEPDREPLVLLEGMNPHICQVRFNDSLKEETRWWVIRKEAYPVLEVNGYYFHSWTFKNDRKRGRMYLLG